MLPSSFQVGADTLANEGHQGQAKATALLQECVWYPEIRQCVKEKIGKCAVCQVTSQPNPPKPIQVTPMPSHAGNEVKIDVWAISIKLLHPCGC